MTDNFWHGKRVFLTGHTGFKGGWLSLWLQHLGAIVTGYALSPSTAPNFFTLAGVEGGMTSIIGDIRDPVTLEKALRDSGADIAFHLAAQPLVRLSYDEPIETYATNVMGTVHLLDAVRRQKNFKSVVVVTSDKCYDNKEWVWGYREDEAMGGHDPYSSSKGCSELVASAYRDSYMRTAGIGLATGRAGNVIGGGDWSKDRLVPDILNAIANGQTLSIRSPKSIRPWQHVLEPLQGYMMLAEKLYHAQNQYAEGWNFGPLSSDVRPVDWIVEKLSQLCDAKPHVEYPDTPQPHEAQFLSLDSTKAHRILGWHPRWNLDRALQEIALWQNHYIAQKNMRDVSLQQIEKFIQTKPFLETE